MGQAGRNELHRITGFGPAEESQGRAGIDNPLEIQALVGDLPITLFALAETLHGAMQIIQRLPQRNGQGVDGTAEQVNLVVAGYLDPCDEITLLNSFQRNGRPLHWHADAPGHQQRDAERRQAADNYRTEQDIGDDRQS